MNRNIFCNRKGGATIKGKFYPLRTSTFLAMQYRRKADKMEAKRKRSCRKS